MAQRVPTPNDDINLYNDKSLDRSPKKNWVEKVGGLPPNVRARARAICRENPGWTLSRCIATALNAVKYSRATGDSKLPGRQNQRKWIVARHTRAANSWDAKKATNKAKKLVNMANASDKDVAGKKLGTKSSGVNSSSSLDKAKAAYQKKKKSMSPEQRKKCEARLKSSQQRLGKKVGLSARDSDTVELAITKRPSSLGHTGKTASQPRAFGGKFGTKAGAGPKGSTNTTSGNESTTKVEPVTPAQIAAGVSKLSIGQTITLPGGNGKVKRLSTGYQVVKMDGSFNKTFQGQSQAVMAANRLIGGRRAKDVKVKKETSTVPGKAGA